MTVLAIDMGTSVVKAVLFTDDGDPLACERAEVTLSRPRPGWAEQDMDELWRTVCSVAAAAVHGLGEDIRLVVTTAQGDGCWLVDRDGRPTGPAILWQDARAAEMVEDWHRDGVLDKAADINGSVAFAGLPSAIMRWLQTHDPTRLDEATAVLTCNGWIHSRMTGRVLAELSDASVPFLDACSGDYSPALLELYGMSWVERLLPPPTPFDSTPAELTRAAAEAMDVRPGVPVVMAPYDVVTAALGLGVTEPGAAFTVLGTTLCTGTAVPAVPVRDNHTGIELFLGDRHPIMRVFPTLVGTGTLSWAAQVLGLGTPQALVAEALRCQPGADGLVFLPYLSGGGERAPFLDVRIRGSWTNLTVEHQRPALARSVLEGLSMTVRDCLAAATSTRPVERLHVCGGGARSRDWVQLLADVTGTEIRCSADDEAGARGAFVCGLVALDGERDLPEAARSHARLTDAAKPDPRLAQVYDARYQDFVATRDAQRAGTGER